METCPNCNQKFEKLFDMKNIDNDSVEIFASPSILINSKYCIKCILSNLGITQKDLINEEIVRSHNSDFSINLLKGRIGQVIMETIFRDVGYEVYPYGYESYLTNIIKNLKKNGSNNIVKLLRSTPDYILYDKEVNEAQLVEIKTTTVDEANYWIESAKLSSYLTSWNDTIIIVIYLPTMKMVCKKINQLNLNSTKLKNNINGYNLNLKDDFNTLDEEFRLISDTKLKNLMRRIKTEVFKTILQ